MFRKAVLLYFFLYERERDSKVLQNFTNNSMALPDKLFRAVIAGARLAPKNVDYVKANIPELMEGNQR